MKFSDIGCAVALISLFSFSPLIAQDSAQAPANPDSVMEQDIALRAKLEARIKEITSDPAKLKDAMFSGKLRSALCKHCHGEVGNSLVALTPSIAGQNPIYIVDQFQRYGDGRRYDYWMGSLAKTFEDEDKIKLAVYYSRQEMKPAGGGDEALLKKGESLYKQICAECHGDNGRGPEGYARLAGQRPDYIVKMLNEFKKTDGVRYNPWMFQRANMLKNDEEILAVATYLGHLK